MDQAKDIKGLDDELIFIDEDGIEETSSNDRWKILIVDDEASMHTVSKLVLDDFVHDGKKVEILNAYSAEEATKIIEETPDLAVILLDVVMEEENSGLKLVKYIREDLGNKLVRIILRTGQPGFAPERKVIIEYDINDYRLKSELTSEKFIVSIVTALRSYHDILVLNMNKKGLEKIIETSSSLFRVKSFQEFLSSILPQLISILQPGKKNYINRTSGFAATKDDNEFVVQAAIGEFKECINKKVDEILDKDCLEKIRNMLNDGKNIYSKEELISYIKNPSGMENLIYLNELNGFSDNSKEIVELFCSNLSIAMDNILLNREVEMTQKEIIFTLGEIAEGRSMETGHHVKRVAEYSKLIALEYGFSQEEADVLSLACPMHDVGKIAIPDAILNKPGKLTAEEFEVMKTHTSIGYGMLKKSHRSIMKAAAIVALQHHERYDGSGYPQGLKGESIHIYGRITAIADVFDALGMKRVYKNAWDNAKIFEYFEQERGKQFDPQLVDVFFKSIDKMLEIRSQLSDRLINGNEL